MVTVELSPVRARHATELARSARSGRLTALPADFYTTALEGVFQAVCCWETSGLGSDADQRRLLMHIAGEWPAPGGKALLDVYNPCRPAREAGTEVRLDALEGVPDSVEMIERCHFDPWHSRWIDEWAPVARPETARAQSIRCCGPADLVLLLEGTGLELQHIEVAGEPLPLMPRGGEITLSTRLLEAWSYPAVPGQA